jgi:hypothetical protein
VKVINAIAGPSFRLRLLTIKEACQPAEELEELAEQETRRILVSRPDGKFVVIEVGAGALVSRFTSN